MKWRLWQGCFLVCLWTAGAGAQPLTLHRAYELALANDPEYRVALGEHEAAVLNRDIGRAAWRPVVSFAQSLADNKANRTVQDPALGSLNEDLRYRSHLRSVNLRQPLLNEEATAKLHIGDAKAEHGTALLSGRRQQLALRLLLAWSEMQLARRKLEFAQSQQDVYLEQLKLNERKRALGEGTLTEILETRTKYELSRGLVTESRLDISSKTRVVEAIVGRSLASVPDWAAELSLDGLSGSLRDDEAYWLERAMASNAELTAHRSTLRLAELEVDKNRAGHLPRLDMVASLSRSQADSLTTVNQRSQTGSIGVQLNVPIYAGGAVDAGVRQALATLDAQRAEYDRIKQELSIEIRKLVSLMVVNREKHRALVDAREAAEQLVTASRKSVLAGVRINLDVLNAISQVYLVRRDMDQALHETVSAWARLQMFAGQLDDVAMTAVSRAFLPIK